jgi:dTDP-4-dehydrorhamnose reductase
VINDSRDILIAGGDGLIGAALTARLTASGHRVWATTRRPDEVGAMRPYHDLADAGEPVLPSADTLIITAANARLADCEADPKGSRLVNVDGTVALAARYTAQGAQVIFLSSDKVFDGTRPQRRREEAVCPATAYGAQKAAAEGSLRDLPGTAIIRLSKVLSPEAALLNSWHDDLAGGQKITPFDDLYLAPVTTTMVAEMIGNIVADRAAGIFHCTGAEDRSYSDLARTLAHRGGFDPVLIRPVAAPATAMPVGGLSRYTTLDMSLEAERWGIRQPAFEDIVAELS